MTSLVPLNRALEVLQVEREPLTQEDYLLIKQACKKYRDLLLIKCLRGTGLRISELLRVTPAYFREEGPYDYILVRRGKKRDKDKTPIYEKIYLPPELAVELKSYIKGNDIKPQDRIFPITSSRVRQISYGVTKAALGIQYGPHSFRHLYIKDLIDHGLPSLATSKMVGHKDVKTTEKAYYKLSSRERQEIQRRIPV